MAAYFYHDFSVQFSITNLFVFIAIFVYAIVGGKSSVKVLPRHYSARIKRLYPGGKLKPAKDVRKAEEMRYSLPDDFGDAECSAESYLHFCSTTRDNVLALISGFAFAILFAKEHFDGMTQFFINMLNPKDAAVWGDILAAGTIGAIGFGITVAFYLIRRNIQIITACKIQTEYLKQGVRLRTVEDRPLMNKLAVIAWFIIEYAKAKKMEKEEA